MSGLTLKGRDTKPLHWPGPSVTDDPPAAIVTLSRAGETVSETGSSIQPCIPKGLPGGPVTLVSIRPVLAGSRTRSMEKSLPSRTA